MSEFLDGQEKLINELKKDKRVNSILSKRIVYKNDFVGAVISGQRRAGKSVYMMMVLYELYKHDWDEVFNHIFFTMEDFTSFLKEALYTGVRVPCVALDDAGVHFGAQQYNTHRNQVSYISALMDTIGIITKSLILTVPNSGNLIKSIRTANFYHVELHQGRNKYDRVAKGYLLHTSPKGQIWPSHEFDDNFDVRLPEHIYERYSQMRRKYSIDTLQSMEMFLGKEQGAKIYKNGNKKYCEVSVGDE